MPKSAVSQPSMVALSSSLTYDIAAVVMGCASIAMLFYRRAPESYMVRYLLRMTADALEQMLLQSHQSVSPLYTHNPYIPRRMRYSTCHRHSATARET